MRAAPVVGSQHIAFFDFDGTITRRDSLLPFLLYASSGGRLARGVRALAWTGPAMALHLMSRDTAKEAVLSAVLGALDEAEFERVCGSFAEGPLQREVRPEALERISWHRQNGHRLALVSASLEGYLAPWAATVGFDDVLATRLVVRDGRLTGRLDGANCRGAEKVRRIRERFGDLGDTTVHAYGDSRADREMLAMADFPHYRELGHG